MASFIVSGKKLEDAEMKIRELETKLDVLEKENTTLLEQMEILSKENSELKEQIKNVLVSVDKKDLEKVKDDIVGKAKGVVGDYFKELTK